MSFFVKYLGNKIFEAVYKGEGFYIEIDIDGFKVNDELILFEINNGYCLGYNLMESIELDESVKSHIDEMKTIINNKKN